MYTGESLRAFIRRHPQDIDVVFVESFLETMFGLLFELKERQSHHGDLHAGNILVARS